MGDLRSAFGQKVRDLRLHRGWSQETLAERAAMHWTYISGLERGRRNPGLNALGQLAHALNLTVSDLLDGLESGTRPKAASRASRKSR